MNIKKVLGDSASFLVPALVIGLWILGAFHGKKKHNIDPFSSNFLVCWYYGLEVIWHKTDYKELNDDVKVAVFLIISKPDTFDPKAQLEFNESKKDFKKVIDKLDKKELAYVKDGTNMFINYISAFQKDMIETFANYKTSRQFTPTESDNTKRIYKKCLTYGLEKEMQELKRSLDDFTNNFKDKLETGSEDIDESLIDEEKIRLEVSKKAVDIKKTFQEIFNE